jgi:hypothetical protein
VKIQIEGVFTCISHIFKFPGQAWSIVHIHKNWSMVKYSTQLWTSISCEFGKIIKFYHKQDQFYNGMQVFSSEAWICHMELLSSLLKTLSLMSQWSYYQVCSKQMDHHSTISQLWGMIAGLTWSTVIEKHYQWTANVLHPEICSHWPLHKEIKWIKRQQCDSCKNNELLCRNNCQFLSTTWLAAQMDVLQKEKSHASIIPNNWRGGLFEWQSQTWAGWIIRM